MRLKVSYKAFFLSITMYKPSDLLQSIAETTDWLYIPRIVMNLFLK